MTTYQLRGWEENGVSHGFLVHGDDDHVGVAVRDLHAGEQVDGVIVTSRQPVQIRVLVDIPLGHKVALVDLQPGDRLLKYHEVIGVVTAPIHAGEHVHVHNLKSVRWG